MLASIQASTLWGVESQPVLVEVHIGNGLPSFTVVGQPDTACREARDRVRAALLSSGYAWPQTRVTVNLAPAEVRKAGASLDLAIAVGMIVASGEIPQERVEGRGFLGELGLDGSLRRMPGTIPLVDALAGSEVVLPHACAGEARLIQRGRVRGVSNLREVVEALQGLAPWPDDRIDDAPLPAAVIPDFADVRGQSLARTAAEIAVAGGHHLLLCGPPLRENDDCASTSGAAPAAHHRAGDRGRAHSFCGRHPGRQHTSTHRSAAGTAPYGERGGFAGWGLGMAASR